MARYIGAVCRICRREGQKLFLKGERCYTAKCSISRRSYLPGQHGKGRKKQSEYGLQLRAKQKTKRFYGMLEKQFRHYFDLASKIKEGKIGENFLSLLESRLDNVIYRSGWAGSRAKARQLVNHGHFLINGKRVDIPSYLTKIGEVVSICDKSRSKLTSESKSGITPKWLEKNSENSEVKVIAKPSREDIDLEVEETLIVELYSK